MVQQTQSLSDSVRVAGRPTTMALAAGNVKETTLHRLAKTLSVVTSIAEDKSTSGKNVGSKVVVRTTLYMPPCNRNKNLSSPFSSHQTTLLPTSGNEIASSDPLSPSPTSIIHTPPRMLRRSLHSRLCLGPHAVCPLASESY